MRTYQTLMARLAEAEARSRAKLEALREEAEQLKRAERDGVIDRIREALTVYEIKVEELYDKAVPKAPRQQRRSVSSAKGRKLNLDRSPKYRNPATGDEWSGYGGWPMWVRKLIQAKHGGKLSWGEFVKQYSIEKLPPAELARKAKEHKERTARRARAKNRPRYVDPETGDQWSGGGSMPNWMRDRLLEGHVPDDYLNPDLVNQRAAAA